MSFGSQIRALRRDLDLGQAALGVRAGCSVNTIRKLEADERRPSRELADRLAEVFGLSLRERAAFVRLARGALAGRAGVPSAMTRLIGREQDVARLRERFLGAEVRLLTLVGPPGVGKTRLALQLATELQGLFTHGAAFVALAALRDPLLVVESIAQTLGVRSTATRSLEQALVEQLRTRQLLLVLDNFEQVLAARELVAALLAAAPGLRVLVASREALSVYGEHVYVVPTLQPGPASTLFVERARATRPNFASDARDQRIVAEICTRLEGLPLALELAASRARTMNPRMLLDGLAQRLELLSAGPRDVSNRQRSIWGALEWSYELLDEHERSVFARFSAFSGGATLEAVSAVCSDGAITESIVVEAVEGLAGKSLLQVHEVGGMTRFDMLETIREYALERLVPDRALLLRHAEYFVSLAERAGIGLNGGDQVTWLQRLTADHDNLREAVSWSFDNGADALAGRLCAALWPFWRTRGFVREGRRLLTRALALGSRVPRPSRATALNGAGVLALIQNEYALAGQLLIASRDLFLALGDVAGVAFAVSNLGWLAHDSSDTGRAQSLFEESLELRRAVGDQAGEASSLNNLGMMALERAEHYAARGFFGHSAELYRRVGSAMGLAQALSNLGWAEQELGDYARATELFFESLALARQLEDARGAAHTLSNLALMALYGAEYARANDFFVDALAGFNELGDRRGVAEALEGLAGVSGLQGRPHQAARLFGLAEALREVISAPLLPADRSRYESVVAPAREQLDERTWLRAWTEGRATSLEEVVGELVGPGSVAARSEQRGGAGERGRHRHRRD